MNEIWAKIPGYENYMVSNLGEILSLNTNKKMSLHVDRYGYLKINLSNKGTSKTKSVHQLVAMAFLNLTPDGTMNFVVNHIDCNKMNNNVNNLEVVSCRENINHSLKLKNKKCNTLGVNMGKDGKFFTCISYNNKDYYLGRQINEAIAGEIYNKACEAIKNNEFETFYKKNKLENKKKFSSKYNGVSKHPIYEKWILNVRINGKNKRIGQYDTEDEAYKQSLIINEKIKNNLSIETVVKKNINKIDKFICKDKYGFRVVININNNSYYVGIFDTVEESKKYRDEALIHIKSDNINEFLDKIKNRHLQETEYDNLFFNTKLNKWVIKKSKKNSYYNSKKTAIKYL